MNATLALLNTRRSVPAQLLAEPGPNAAELEQILTVAARVPDHGKLTPWRFIVIAGEARVRVGGTIAAAFQADEPGADAQRVAVERGRLTRAPLVIGVVSRAAPHPKIPEGEQVLSAGAVCMNLIVAANALGFGTVWLTEWPAYDCRILTALGLTPAEALAGFIHIGRSPGPQPDRPRPALADLVTRI